MEKYFPAYSETRLILKQNAMNKTKTGCFRTRDLAQGESACVSSIKCRLSTWEAQSWKLKGGRKLKIKDQLPS